MRARLGIWFGRLVLIAIAIGFLRFIGRLDGVPPVPPPVDPAALAEPGVERDETALAVGPAAPSKEPAEPPSVPEFVAVRLSGTITAGSEAKTAGGAALRVYRTDDSGAVVEASATADEQGAYLIELPVARHWADPDGRVWIGLEAHSPEGSVLRELGVHLFGRLNELGVDVWLEPGGAFTGQIAHEDGAPAADADVYLYGSFGEPALDPASGEPNGDPTSDPTGDRWVAVDSAVTLPDGRFLVHYRDAGNYTLRARAEGRGSTLRDLGARSETAREDLGAIRLSGGSSLAGRIVDPTGNGVGGLLVQAASTKLAIPLERLSSAGLDPAAAEAARLAEGSLGQLYGQARTDPSGQFRIEGLAPGSFWLRCEAPALETETASGPYATGASDLRIVVAEYRLTVELGARPDGIVPRGRAYCIELEPSSLGYEPAGDSEFKSLFENPRARFRVQPGRTYAVGIASSSLPVLERIVTIEPGDYRPVVELSPGRAASFGRVRLWVGGANGRPLGNASIDVRAPESNVTLQTVSATIGSGGFALDLAPGTYRLVAGPRPWPRLDTPLLPAMVLVQVESDRTLDLELHTRKGAELVVSLEPDGDLGDAELNAIYEVVLETGQRPSAGLREKHGALIHLTPPDGGRAHGVEFVFADGSSPEPPGALLPGETGTLKAVLEAGIWSLELELEGFESARQLVDLRAGETTRVALPLRRSAGH